MDPSESSHRRNQSTPHAIPLQDLGSRSAERLAAPDDSPSTHRRTLSDRGRDLFQHSRDALLQRDRHGVRYAPVNPQSRGGIGLGLAIDTDVSNEVRSGHGEQNSGFSPVGPGFQEAMGFSGLSHIDNSGQHLTTTPTRRAMRFELPALRTAHPDDDEEETRSLMDEELVDGTGAFPHEEDADTTPLTDTSRTPSRTSPRSQRHDRHTPERSAGNVSFLSPAGADGAHDPELGTLSPGAVAGRSRSGSNLLQAPNSPIEAPLRRAGTIIGKLSQRVVNLSNESEIVEKSIKRSPSVSNHDFREASRPSTPTIRVSQDGRPPAEKVPSPVRVTPLQTFPDKPTIREPNPLRGKSLGIFGSENKIRRTLLEFLTNALVEPVILVLIVLQTVLLAADATHNVYNRPRTRDWGNDWIDYALLALFSIYTVELSAKIIVSGFIINPVEFSTIDRRVAFGKAVLSKANAMFSPHRKASTAHHHHGHHQSDHPQPVIRSFTTQDWDQVPGTHRQAQRNRLARRAFLRHSFNRLDFLAVVAFWLSFFISIFGVESKQHLYVFRMLSCLRILRLLGLTSGTLVILRSLKRAMPILLNVAFLIGFFWLLFAIVGVQSFKSSLRRTCVWQDPDGILPDYAQNTAGNFQFCGGWLAPNGTAMAYLRPDGRPALEAIKGYWCPVNSKCIESDNPYNGTVSFDNLPQSLEMIFVIMTSNTFSDIMYYLTNTDYLLAALFYAFGIIILTLWMVNLLIAVITSSFQIIREESKTSAFAAEQTKEMPQAEEVAHSNPRTSTVKRLFEKTYWFWIAVIAFDIISQAMRSSTMSDDRAAFISVAETAVTLVLDIEILLRLAVDWRNFFRYRRNIVDLTLAIITSIIQIPVIRDSGKPYAWLTIFQILRVYRLVLSVKVTRELIMLVLGNVSGLANLILFVFLLTFLAAIFATQLFRGELPAQDINGNELEVSFFSMWNAFLGMYQMLSSENWTAILYNVTQYQVGHNNGWVGAGFCILWYILANFVVLNMFIAVIQENFDVSEDEKRLQQVKAFLQQKRFVGSTAGVLSLSSIFKFGNAKRQDPLDYGAQTSEMLLKDAVVRDFLDDTLEASPVPQPTPIMRGATGLDTDDKMISKLPGARLWMRMREKIFQEAANPFYGNLEMPSAEQDFDPRNMARQVVQAAARRKEAQKAYLKNHPNYLTSLYIFKPDNSIRRLCQKIVGPGRGGDRIQGPMPSAPVWYAFSAFVYAAIVAMVVLACVTTPLYQKSYFAFHGFSRMNWFVWTDLGFATIFTVEALIKVIADGFFWTPNAYFRSSWGMIDGIVLITLWASVYTLLRDPGSGSRTVGALKALRALRLLNISDSARDTFHSVIVRGGWKVFSAALVSLSLLIPFAVYGLTLFNGQMLQCNDGGSGIFQLSDCVDEYMSSPYAWNVLAPRTVTNSYYSFDDFGKSLFILFQIVSQEGWIDVMWSGQSITGVFTQPAAFASQHNAVFFVIFNLLGAVFVLTLFVSVFMRNYTEQTGVAFLTTEQRSWLELRKLLRQVSPSKRPSSKRQRQTWQDWCYRQSVQKNGKWQRAITGLLMLHLILLCLEWYPDSSDWLRIRDVIFLGLTLIFAVNIIVRVVGLSWQRFRKSAWDVYSVIVVAGTLITTVLNVVDTRLGVHVQVHKLFLVAIALMLIPRNNQLDQLFKTAAASFTSISNLLATWFVMFLVFAIALNQTFGLTRFGPNETSSINFRDIPRTLILLFRISVGEGWNQLMNDFASIEKPFCTVGDRYFDGDCGSEEWARALFIGWNIMSMYIFVNLFVSLIYESFSYVYQRSSGLSVVSREEIRRFKQAWAEHDPNGTGYISKEAFPRLLGELSGVFEMRIYDGDFTVGNILDDCRINTNRLTAMSFDRPKNYYGVDIEKLNARLADLPIDEIRMRRRRMNAFYEEVIVSADADKGIEFGTLLMILAHYKVINDSRSLRLEEFLRRRARLQRVEEAVSRDVVMGFFDTLYWTRRFRQRLEARRERSRMTAVPSHDYAVPEIYVQDESTTEQQKVLSPTTGATQPMTPTISQHSDSVPSSAHHTPSSIGGISPRNRNPSTPGSISLSPSYTGTPNTRDRADSNASLSPTASPTRARRPDVQGSWHLSSALNQPFDINAPLDGTLDPSSPTHHRSTSAATTGPRLGADLATANTHRTDLLSTTTQPNRGRSNTSVSARDIMLGELDNSVWGESIRRSFTTKRGSGATLAPHQRSASGLSLAPTPEVGSSSTGNLTALGRRARNERGAGQRSSSAVSNAPSVIIAPRASDAGVGSNAQGRDDTATGAATRPDVSQFRTLSSVSRMPRGAERERRDRSWSRSRSRSRSATRAQVDPSAPDRGHAGRDSLDSTQDASRRGGGEGWI